MRLRSGTVVECRGRCYKELMPGTYVQKRKCTCVLKQRCPNVDICNCDPVPEWREGYCEHCTVALSATKIQPALPGECPVCLEYHSDLVAAPAGCKHGICKFCFKTMFMGPKLPVLTHTDADTLRHNVIDWFENRAMNAEQLQCPVCRQAPSPGQRLFTMTRNSMFSPRELFANWNVPSRIMALMLVQKLENEIKSPTTG